jgi:hypothetical protein
MTSEFFQNCFAAYKKFFWPDFVAHDGCVFLAFDEDIYRQWFEQTGGDRRKIESVMNHRHIIDILPATLESPTRNLVVAYGQLLRDVWETKLHRDFPTRRFCVSFPSEHCEDLTDYEVTFYQVA